MEQKRLHTETMKTFPLLAFLLLGAGPALAEGSRSAPPSDTSIAGDASLRSSAIEDAYQQTRVMGIGVDASLKQKLGEDWHATVTVGAIIETGSAESFFSDEYKPANTLTLSEASVSWTPHASSRLKLGALDQSFHDSPLLLRGVTFPGFFQSWKSAPGRFRLELTAEQAIPVSSTGSVVPVQKTGAPFYDMERASVRFESPLANSELRISHFAFQNLAGGIANESRFRGNSVAGIGDSGSQFVYAYEGIEAALKIDWSAGAGVRPAAALKGIVNLRAPSERARTLSASFSASIPAGRGATVTPALELFRAEADASPGYYNSGVYAHNNRQGASLGGRADIPSGRVALELQFIRANVIEPTPFQADFTGLFFSLRKSYDLL